MVPVSFFSLLTKLVSISIFVSMCTLITSLIVAKFVSQDVFGLYSFYQSFFMLLQNLLPFGFSMAVVVFKSRLSNYEYSALLSFSLCKVVPLLALTAAILCVSFLFLTGNQKSISVFLSLISYAAFQSALVIRLASFRVSYRLKDLAKIMFFNSLFTLLVSLVYFYFFDDFVIFYLILSIVSFCALLLSIFFEKDFIERGALLSFEDKKKYISFGWPVATHTVLSSFLVAGDKIILGFLTDSLQLGFYAYASTASSLFLFIVNNYASSWGVHLSNFIARSSADEIKVYYKKNIYYPFLFVLLVPPFFIVIWFFGYFFDIVNVEEFYVVSFFIVLAYSSYAVTKYYMGYLNCLNKTLLVMRATILSCLVLIFASFFLFNVIGLVGVSIAVFASFLFNMSANFFYSRKVVMDL